NRPTFFNFLSDVRAALGLPASYFNPGGAFNGTGLPVDALPSGIVATQHFRQDRKSRALYAEGSWQFTDRWKLTLGGRYTKDKNEFKEGYSTYFDDTGAARLITVSANPGPYFLAPVGLIPASTGPLPDALEDSGKSSKYSGRAILDWKVTDDVMTYASFSKGY